MTAALVIVLGFAAVVGLTLLQSIVTALFVQDVKGALAERLERNVGRAAAKVPDAELRAALHDEWLGELGAARDRPLKAVAMVRGFRVAARRISADLPHVTRNEAPMESRDGPSPATLDELPINEQLVAELRALTL